MWLFVATARGDQKKRRTPEKCISSPVPSPPVACRLLFFCMTHATTGPGQSKKHALFFAVFDDGRNVSIHHPFDPTTVFKGQTELTSNQTFYSRNKHTILGLSLSLQSPSRGFQLRLQHCVQTLPPYANASHSLQKQPVTAQRRYGSAARKSLAQRRWPHSRMSRWHDF